MMKGTRSNSVIENHELLSLHKLLAEEYCHYERKAKQNRYNQPYCNSAIKI